jgi:hypothetical protein
MEALGPASGRSIQDLAEDALAAVLPGPAARGSHHPPPDPGRRVARRQLIRLNPPDGSGETGEGFGRQGCECCWKNFTMMAGAAAGN